MQLSKLSSRLQAKLITIHKNVGFSCVNSNPFQCDACIQYEISCFERALRNIFASNFWQVTVFQIQGSKCYKGYRILLLEPISFEKIQPPKPGLRQNVDDVISIQRIHHLRYNSRFLLLLSILNS